jgi:hypothetical protein
VTVAPSWRNLSEEPISLAGAADPGFTGPAGGNYSTPDGSAAYGTIAHGALKSCLDEDDCYELSVMPDGNRPLHWDAVFTEIVTATGVEETKAWTVHLGDSFADVFRSHFQYRYVETLLHRGAVGGCGGGNFCPDVATTRAQMAVIVLASKYGAGYAPPACQPGSERFKDVPAGSPYCPWVEELARRGFVSSCGLGPDHYCPDEPVSRGEMSYVVIAAREDPLPPPPCIEGMERFRDVPASDPLCPWIEELSRALEGEGPPNGDDLCSSDHYCPQEFCLRGSASRFLAAGYALRLYDNR